MADKPSVPPATLNEWLRDNAPDCGDNSCLFGGRGKGGMRTNGGCRCFKDLPTAKRIYVERLASFVQSAVAAIERVSPGGLAKGGLGNCPMCALSDKVNVYVEGKSSFVRCDGCGLTTGRYHHPDFAAAMWNSNLSKRYFASPTDCDQKGPSETPPSSIAATPNAAPQAPDGTAGKDATRTEASDPAAAALKEWPTLETAKLDFTFNELWALGCNAVAAVRKECAWQFELYLIESGQTPHYAKLVVDKRIRVSQRSATGETTK